MRERSELGEKLRELRHRARLKQFAVADSAGFSVSTYSRIETGEKLPERWQIVVISEALGVSPSDLPGFESSRKRGR